MSRRTGVPVAVATGVYREPWVPDWVYEAGDEALEAWMHRELTRVSTARGILAGFVKISASEDGIRPVEERVVRAAARAAAHAPAPSSGRTRRTGGSCWGRSTSPWPRACRRTGSCPSTRRPSGRAVRQEIVDRGAWIEFDDVGQGDDTRTLELVLGSLAGGRGTGCWSPTTRGGSTRPCRVAGSPPVHRADDDVPAAAAGGGCGPGRRRRPLRPQPVPRVRAVSSIADCRTTAGHRETDDLLGVAVPPR